MNLYGLKRIRNMIILQMTFVTALALLMWVIRNRHEALSVVLGGVCVIIPVMLFALRYFQHQGVQAAKQIMKGFYRAEVLKIISSVLLISFVLLVFQVKPFGFLLGFIMTTMTIWFAPLVFK